MGTMGNYDVSMSQYLEYSESIWIWTLSNVSDVYSFGAAQLVQPPSLAGAQVEANFSDAETSLQLAEVGDVKWCPNSKPKLPELRKKQAAWRVSTIFHVPLLLEMHPNDHSIVG